MRTHVRASEPDLNRKAKGDLAELMVAADLRKRGFKLALPYGEVWDFDLIICRGERFERVQVKYTRSDARCIHVQCFSRSLTNGKVKKTKLYTAETVDWIAVYDVTTDRCYYIPASELAAGKTILSLRLAPPRNSQQARIRWARDYLTI